jgi:hypothetical protein
MVNGVRLGLSFLASVGPDCLFAAGESSNYFTDGRVASFYGEPRMYGVQLRYRFGGNK